MDEPSIGLAPKLFQDLLQPIRVLQQQHGMSILLIEQNVREALRISDRVVVMNGGSIEQIASPQDLYHRPKTRFVAGFIGSPAMNFIRCRVEQNGSGQRVRISDQIALPIPASRAARFQSLTGTELTLGLRPEHITEPRRSDRDSNCEFSTNLDVVEPMGMETMVFFRLDGQEVCCRVDPGSAAGPGEPMRLFANMDHMHLIDPESGAVL